MIQPVWIAMIRSITHHNHLQPSSLAAVHHHDPLDTPLDTTLETPPVVLDCTATRPCHTSPRGAKGWTFRHRRYTDVPSKVNRTAGEAQANQLETAGMLRSQLDLDPVTKVFHQLAHPKHHVHQPSSVLGGPFINEFQVEKNYDFGQDAHINCPPRVDFSTSIRQFANQFTAIREMIIWAN